MKIFNFFLAKSLNIANFVTNIKKKQMKEEEFIEKSISLSKEIRNIKNDLLKKKQERCKVMTEYADFLTEKHKSYIGKLIEFNVGSKTQKGFFQRFVYNSDFQVIRPQILKIKSNGQASLVYYPYLSVPIYRKNDLPFKMVGTVDTN